MSSREDCDAVRIGPHRRATRACIRTKEYQRHLDSRDRPRAAASSIRRSTLIGWWMLVTSGRPSPAQPEQPVPQHLVVVDEVEVGPAGPQQRAAPAG